MALRRLNPKNPKIPPFTGVFLISISKREEDWRAAEVEGFAEAAFEVAFVAPVEEAEVAAVDDEPWWASVGLDHITEFRMSVLEAGRWMRIDGVGEQFIEVASLELGMTGGVNLGGELENLRHVFTSDGARKNDWRVWNEIEIIFEIVENFVAALAFEVGLRDDKNNALPGVDNLAGEGLIELGMRLGAIDEHTANVGFFDGCEAAEGAEFFDAYFAFAWLAEAGGVEKLDRATLVANLGAVDVAGSSSEVGNYGLLLLGERVKEARLADIWAANERNLDAIVWLFCSFAHIKTEIFEFRNNLAAELVETDAGRRGDANWLLGAKREELFVWERFAEVGFVQQEKNWFAGLEGLFGDHFVIVIWVFAAIEGEQDEIGVRDGVFDLVLNVGLELVVWVLETGGINEDVAIIDAAHDVIASGTRFARNNSRRLVDEAIKEARFASIGLANDCDDG